MINAYENVKPYLCETMEEYVEQTTTINKPKEVVAYIKNYLKNNVCNDEVRSFLKDYLNNITLLQKIHIIMDGSYRNCCVLIRPDGLIPTGKYYGNCKTIDDYLTMYEQEAEIVFLNITNESWQEVNEWLDYLDDMYYDDDYYDYHQPNKSCISS